MHVVALNRHRNKKVVAVARELLALAEEGDLQGLTFVAQLGRGDHRAGVVGVYLTNPAEAVLAASRLKQRLLAEAE